MVAIAESSARQHWSTTNVEARQALAYWVDTICKSFLEIDIDSVARDRFRAQLEQSEFGPATLYLVEADTQTIRRTPTRIAHSRYDGFFLLQLRAGQIHFQQYGRESRIDVGDSVLIDCGAPYRLECVNTTRSVALRFSREWLRNWLPAPESLAGRPLGGNSWSSALSAALASLDTDGEEALALPEGVVAEQRGGEKILNRIRSTIRDRSHEAGLTPGAVADTNGISKRYLHYLFAQAGGTFGDELMRVRLDRAQRLLSDTRFSALTIIEIAARCGFLEPSHFARRFRKAYGMGPTQFRAAHAH